MARAAVDAFGTIDVLVNNASLMSVLPRRDWMETWGNLVDADIS